MSGDGIGKIRHTVDVAYGQVSSNKLHDLHDFAHLPILGKSKVSPIGSQGEPEAVSAREVHTTCGGGAWLCEDEHRTFACSSRCGLETLWRDNAHGRWPIYESSNQ